MTRDWSEYELAQHAGIPQSTISTWYRKKQMPTIQNIEKICNGLGITLSQFFAEGSDPVDLTPAQREVLDHWAVFTPEQQQSFLHLLKNLCGDTPEAVEK